MRSGNMHEPAAGTNPRRQPQRAGARGTWKAQGLALLVAGAVAAMAAPAAARAQQPAAQAQRVAFDQPAQPLLAALRAFGRQTQYQVLYDEAQLAGLRAPALQGSYTPREAVDRLLAGSGLAAHATEPGTFTLRRVPQAPAAGDGSLAPVLVTAQAEATGSTEGSGSYAQTGPSGASTGLALSLRETPQTVSVVTRQQMDDFGLQALSDVLRHTPGINITNTNSASEYVEFSSRGFNMLGAIQYDGVRGTWYAGTPQGHTLSETAIYDRVEVVKGANGLLLGNGNPSGAINLIRKRPTREFQGQASLSAGSWNLRRAELDVGGPLNAAGTLRGRTVLALQDRDAYLDHYSKANRPYYGVLEADIARDTLLTLGADFDEGQADGAYYGGIRLFDSNGDFTNMPRSFNGGARWAENRQSKSNLFARLEHDFSDRWKARLQLNRLRSSLDNLTASVYSGNPDPVTGAGTSLPSWDPGASHGRGTNDSVDLRVTGSYTLFGRAHDLVLGANASRYDWGMDYLRATGGYADRQVGNYYAWTGDIPYPTGMAQTARDAYVVRNRGAFASTRLRVTDRLAAIAGVRVADYEFIWNPSTEWDERQSGVTIPYAGLTFDVSDTVSAYASFTSIFSPQSAREESGRLLGPIEGNSYELGLKGEFLDKRLVASAAVFRISQDNVAEATGGVTPDGQDAYRALTGVVSRGIEIEVSGQVAPGWQVQAGYTHKVARQKGAKVMTMEPEDQFSFFASHRLAQGAGTGWTLGGGARWVGKVWGNVNNPVRGTEVHTRAAYWVADAFAQYRFTPQLSGQLNVSNLFDRRYYEFSTGYASYSWGEPRKLVVRMDYRF